MKSTCLTGAIGLAISMSILTAAGFAQPETDEGGAFSFNGVNFENQRAFVESGRRCATAEPSVFQRRLVAAVQGQFRAQNAQFRAADVTVEVPIVFHVIHNGNEGKVAEGRIDAQVAVLNAAYSPFKISFKKADLKYHNKPQWFNMNYGGPAERDAKRSLHVDPEKNLNFYTAELGRGLLGWATFPWELAGDPEMDGVVCLHTSLPAAGGGPHPEGNPYNEGDTATHEVGHWLGLFHTFQDGCTEPGDEVDDTPAEATGAFGCPPAGRDTCPALGDDPIRNFMDYVDDRCMDEFTPGQGDRVKDLVAIYRSGLIATPNVRQSLKAIQLDR
jgi:hypothetical protein